MRNGYSGEMPGFESSLSKSISPNNRRYLENVSYNEIMAESTRAMTE
jgi:hypothetical protein